MKHIIYNFLLLFLTSIMLTSCNGKSIIDTVKDMFESDSDKVEDTSTMTKGVANVAIDETFKPVMEQEIQVFQYVYKNAYVSPRYVSYQKALSMLLSDSVQCAVLPYKLNDNQEQYLKANLRPAKTQMIAVDALAIIVNAATPDTMFTISQLADVLSGKSTDWKQLSKSGKSGKISLVFDNSGSSAVQYMSDSILLGKTLTDAKYAVNNTPETVDFVAKYPGAIGVISACWLDNPENTKKLTTNKDIKVMYIAKKDGVKAYLPTQNDIFEANYPLFRQIYMIFTAKSGSISNGFVNFVKSDNGQNIILKTGVLPSHIKTRRLNLN